MDMNDLKEREFYRRVLEQEISHYGDDALYAQMDLERLEKEGASEKEITKARIVFEQRCIQLELAEKELEDLDKGLKWKIEIASEEYVRERANAYFEEQGIYMGFTPPGRLEDYGIDMMATGYTEDNELFGHWYEVKTLRGEWGKEDTQRTWAGRNPNCRYCDSAATKEEFDADATPRPDWAETDTPIAVINATTKYGEYRGSKEDTLKEKKAGLVFITKDRIYIFHPSDFKKAIIGHYWILGTHEEDYGGAKKPRVWERKAAIALDRATWTITTDAPDEIMRKK